MIYKVRDTSFYQCKSFPSSHTNIGNELFYTMKKDRWIVERQYEKILVQTNDCDDTGICLFCRRQLVCDPNKSESFGERGGGRYFQ